MNFFSFEEVLHSPYIGDSRIEGIRVDFGVFSHRGEQVYILIFEPLQELDCSVQSFAPRVEVLELVAHLTISTFSLSDIITDCLPSAKPSSIPPMSREIV